eukprot:TRINITY_DN6154_c0_g1_i4.p1 TRINITY_DN6154_c0_g1~~TRINITY_DN6154_c0_g1_i4.p1  ORF type:complete len:152 (+),score=26.27 TRINITY_DN6154_c0_g1_i4:180-635(+)
MRNLISDASYHAQSLMTALFVIGFRFTQFTLSELKDIREYLMIFKNQVSIENTKFDEFYIGRMSLAGLNSSGIISGKDRARSFNKKLAFDGKLIKVYPENLKTYGKTSLDKFDKDIREFPFLAVLSANGSDIFSFCHLDFEIRRHPNQREY